jgi:hypothetical protein
MTEHFSGSIGRAPAVDLPAFFDPGQDDRA